MQSLLRHREAGEMMMVVEVGEGNSKGVFPLISTARVEMLSSVER